MQYHSEEFSVTDVRHTLSEVWRVVSSRRWYFVFPFCAASTLALLCSLMVPRQWAGSTVIKREPDPVFASMVGEAWANPYNEIRQRMDKDVQDLGAVEQVLKDMNLPEGLERFADGELTPASAAALHEFAQRVAAGLTVTLLETSPKRDVASIRLVLSDAIHVQEILRRIRDHYIASTKRKTAEVLQDVKQFFVAESERCRGQLAAVQKRMLEMEVQYPGVDPDSAERAYAGEASLVVERIQLERAITDATDSQNRIREELKTLSEGGKPESGKAAAALKPEPNFRYQELQREVERVLREIVDGRTLRFMTEQHPVIQQLRAKLAALQEELSRTPRERYITEGDVAGEAAQQAAKAAVQKLEAQAAEVDAKLTASRGRLKEVGEAMNRLERQRALAVEHRQEYSKLKQEAARVDAELTSWAQNLGSIERVLTVEDRNRTVHFTTVEDVGEITKPVLPSLRVVLISCFGLGLAVAAITVLLTELLDRSYRTIRQLRSSLGITVIESTDEIITQALARKRWLRRFVLMPAAAAAAVGAVLLSATIAYMSVENPSELRLLKSAPQDAGSLVDAVK